MESGSGAAENLDPTSGFHSINDPFDGYHVSSLSHIDLEFLAGRQYGLISGCHLFIQPLVNHIFFPWIHVEVLYHFKIGNGNTAGIAQEVRNDMDAFL